MVIQAGRTRISIMVFDREAEIRERWTRESPAGRGHELLA